MKGNSCPIWKYWLLILTGSGFHSWNFAVSYLIFPVYFSPRPAVLVAEGDGWMSLCSFADRRAGNMSVPDFTLVCVGARVQHSLCTKKKKKKFLAFEEAVLLWLQMERDDRELTIWSVRGESEGCCLSVAVAITRQGQGLFSAWRWYAVPWPPLFRSTL